MTAPIDRVYVEVLPMFKGFNEKVKSDVTASVASAGKDMEKVSESVGKSTERIAKESEGLFSRVKDSAKELLFSFGPAAAGFGAVEFIKGSVEAADEMIKLTKQTAATIKSTGEAAHVSAKDVTEYSDKLSEQTGITADVIRNNENLLLTFTSVRNEVGKGNDIFTQATKEILDMSTALKEDGKSASIQLGKALNDPIKGITALSRVGVSFTEQQKKTIKSMVEHNNVLGAQKVILGELNREFGGSAVAQATAGQKLKATYHEVEEAVGARLLPVIEKAAEFITHDVLPAFIHMAEDVGKGTGVIGALAKIIDILKTTLHPVVDMVISFARQGWAYLGGVLQHLVVPVLKTVGEWMKRHGDDVRALVVGIGAAVLVYKTWMAVTKVMTAVQTALDVAMDANPVGILVVGIAALIAALTYAYFHSKRFRDIVDDVGRHLRTWGVDVARVFVVMYHNVIASIHDITHNVTASWHDITHNVTASVHDIVHNVSASWNDIVHNVSASVHDIVHNVTASWNDIVSFFKGIVPWAGRLGTAIITGIWNGLKNAWNTVLGWFHNIPGWIKSALGIHSPPAWAVDAGSWIMRALVKGLIGGAFSFNSFLSHFAAQARTKLASIAGSIGGGFASPSGALLDWIHLAEKLTGVNDAWTPGLLTLIGRESGGNPNAINNWDINAQHGDPSRGLMQTIGATFNRYHQPGTSWNIYDPVANIAAGIRYIEARYGGIWNVQQADPTRPPKGYATGAWNIPTNQLAYLHAREMVIPAGPADAIRAGVSGRSIDDLFAVLTGIHHVLQRLAPDIADGVGRHLGTVTTNADSALGARAYLYARTA